MRSRVGLAPAFLNAVLANCNIWLTESRSGGRLRFMARTLATTELEPELALSSALDRRRPKLKVNRPTPGGTEHEIEPNPDSPWPDLEPNMTEAIPIS